MATSSLSLSSISCCGPVLAGPLAAAAPALPCGARDAAPSYGKQGEACGLGHVPLLCDGNAVP